LARVQQLLKCVWNEVAVNEMTDPLADAVDKRVRTNASSSATYAPAFIEV
jgi:hypothetical protein